MVRGKKSTKKRVNIGTLKNIFVKYDNFSKEEVYKIIEKNYEITKRRFDLHYNSWRKEYVSSPGSYNLDPIKGKSSIVTKEEFIEYYSRSNRKGLCKEEIEEIVDFLLHNSPHTLIGKNERERKLIKSVFNCVCDIPFFDKQRTWRKYRKW